MTGSPWFSLASTQGCETVTLTVPVTANTYFVNVTLNGISGISAGAYNYGATSVPIQFRLPNVVNPVELSVASVLVESDQEGDSTRYSTRQSEYTANQEQRQRL